MIFYVLLLLRSFSSLFFFSFTMKYHVVFFLLYLRFTELPESEDWVQVNTKKYSVFLFSFVASLSHSLFFLSGPLILYIYPTFLILVFVCLTISFIFLISLFLCTALHVILQVFCSTNSLFQLFPIYSAICPVSFKFQLFFISRRSVCVFFKSLSGQFF